MHIADPLLRVDDPFEGIARDLDAHGYCIIDDLVPTRLVDALAAHVRTLDAAEFHRAGVGRDQRFRVDADIRRDAVSWLIGNHAASATWLAWSESLRLALNRYLFLGLFDYEAHYAWYPPGAFYRRHLDAFRGRSTRRLSTVLYLNGEWGAEDGGELLIHAPAGERVLERVRPSHGRFVVFLSEVFPHEVLPTRRSRLSVVGWFRVNESIGGALDPPR